MLKFSISAKALRYSLHREIFEPAKTVSGVSTSLLEKLGGTSQLLHCLRSSKTQGIAHDPQELKTRKKEYTPHRFGKNYFASAPKPSYCRILFHHLSNKIIQILIVAAFISLATGTAFHPDSGWVEGALLLFLVFIVVNLSSITDFINEKQFIKMSKAYGSASVIVIRDGIEL